MSAAELLDELSAMPQAERAAIFARLVENEQWREDILDLITIVERLAEPTRPIDDVYRDLGIDA